MVYKAPKIEPLSKSQMIHLTIIILSIWVLLFLSGCADLNQTLISANGQKYNCRTSGYGIIGSMVATSRFNDCVQSANEKGYK